MEKLKLFKIFSQKIATNLTYENFSKIFSQIRNIENFDYEKYLAIYKPELRKENGVFYTPNEIVKFIISATDTILKTDFSIEKGIADDKKITILDFATGTGMFLLEIFKQILENLTKKKQIIRQHLLKNIFGFEISLPPLIIAYLKLSQLLTDFNIRLEKNEHFQLFQTNTIADQHPDFEKNCNEILIITGNPPYSIHSKNQNSQLIDVYKENLNEKKINLDDDYIKFIRFAQEKIAKFGKGIIAIITNNSYLDGLSHRRMRETLYNDFDKIYILNLHGNSIKNEGDKNVFDIRVGVNIAIFIKFEKKSDRISGEKEVFYFSTLENGLISREAKKNFLASTSLNDVHFEKIKPVAPNFWFTNKIFQHQNYLNFWKITDIFEIYSSGIETQRDSMTIHFSEEELNKVLSDLQNLSVEEIKLKYNLSVDGRDWTLKNAIKSVSSVKKERILKIHYRPFDFRYTYLNEKSKGFLSYPREKIMKHFLKNNIGLQFSRAWHFSEWNACVITENICANAFKAQSYVAPLYLFSENNFAKANFTEKFSQFIENQYFTKDSEKIFAYIYAILHSKTYRTKYLEFLKIDFPKIPFTENVEIFEKLADLGQKLIDLHLTKINSLPQELEKLGIFNKNSENLYIKKVKFSENKIFINENAFFRKCFARNLGF